MTLNYSEIEDYLAATLPELRPAIDTYWQSEGAPGEDAGPYILYEDLFRPYVTVLLDAPESPTRETLLRRAFQLVEDMLRTGGEVANLVSISVFEGQPRRWFELAKPFLGPLSRDAVKAWEDDFDGPLDPGVDLYGVGALAVALQRGSS